MLHYIQLNRNNRCDSSIHSAQKMTKKVHVIAGLKLHLFFIAKLSDTSVLLSNAVLTFDTKSVKFHKKKGTFLYFWSIVQFTFCMKQGTHIIKVGNSE